MASSALGKVLLIPCYLDEEHLETIPAYVLEAVQSCQVFFVENERTARRYLKRLWKEMVIDNYSWFPIQKLEAATTEQFRQQLKRGHTVGILSEAGCPGIADPGQLLVAAAQEMMAEVKPLVGPSSILLALMASGMNGQQFRFAGYLPIDNAARNKQIRELEQESQRLNCTQIFIETPYRNHQLFEQLLQHCRPDTRLCVAVDITGTTETIKTRTIAGWKKFQPDWHKRPAIFLLYAGNN
ncbi:SAM-dependent methyltransferase [Flavihumibacter petaseus]|uniref:Putative methyltransferase n=1 Tax=Flavihumibacter petaseus NBRC 106054 TaxID=1220578 RepID=A0A0E9MV44_9BACT|nr:SAM-dependent methyltransferase [Flavihumibacter petaseus]GAO41622.1 putative methyltransferase [Flavihumibacter petaseus NBRC 106054]